MASFVRNTREARVEVRVLLLLAVALLVLAFAR
jgi:hypothetical protein